jgi:uncharacterized protein
MLILVSGLPGTGKSTLGSELGSHLDAIVLSRDWAREELLPVVARSRKWLSDAARRRLRMGHPRWAQRRAADLLDSVARRHLLQGRSVLLEMVASPDDRRRWARLAQSLDSPYVQVECFCSDAEVHMGRLAERSAKWTEIVERVAEVYVCSASGWRGNHCRYSGSCRAVREACPIGDRLG